MRSPHPVAAKSTQATKPDGRPTLLFCFTGSIACFKVLDAITAFREAGANVYCLMTKAAAQFVTPLTLESLSGNRVYSDQFGENPFPEPLHTSLADRATAILVAPASADVMAKLAHGLADDLVTSTVLASRAPLWIAPAMNDNMWNHPATQANAAALRRHGARLIGPVVGHLVCHREGVGHVAPVEDIVSALLPGLGLRVPARQPAARSRSRQEPVRAG